ncbi:MAG: hypothetical protein ABIO79_13760 [Ferruginibacter sp.]
MKKFFFVALMMACVSFSNQSFAQSSRGTDVVGSKVDKSRGASQYTLPTTDVEAPKPDKSRGTCCINFDNWTGYTVYVWVDGVFKGTVNAWQDGGVCVGSGWTKWYARTAGGTYEWSGEGDCQGNYNLKLK